MSRGGEEVSMGEDKKCAKEASMGGEKISRGGEEVSMDEDKSEQGRRTWEGRK